MSHLIGILFLINTVDSSIATAKSGRIIQVGISGTVGVEVAVAVEFGVRFGAPFSFGKVGVGVEEAEVGTEDGKEVVSG